MGEEVRLVDLEVIKRYSLAVRQESAPADDILAALDASRLAVLAAMGKPADQTRPRKTTPKAAPAAKKAPAARPERPSERDTRRKNRA